MTTFIRQANYFYLGVVGAVERLLDLMSDLGIGVHQSLSLYALRSAHARIVSTLIENHLFACGSQYTDTAFIESEMLKSWRRVTASLPVNGSNLPSSATFVCYEGKRK